MSNLKVLIGCIFFRDFTGSEMYVYELAKNLKLLDVDVSIVSAYLGEPLCSIANGLGIKTYNFNNLPKNQIFNIIHVQHAPVAKALIEYYPLIKKIYTIHSEIIDVENPIMHNSIYKYIAIRPEIKKHLIKNFKIPENDINIIYNPFDFNKFNTNNISDENFILFVGSLENLRKKPLYDIMEYAKNNNKELWIVGKNHSNYLDELLKNNHVKYFNSCENIETFVKKCSETAGILLGRTTIEGWLCGKSGWIYNVDNEGNILNKDKHLPPDDLTKFNSIEVAKKVKKLYIKALS